jgi:prolyl-tRNA synthetase
VTADPKRITRKSEDFDRWYVDVVRRAELADYTPIKGCMVIRPYGFALWERVRDALDAMIKRTGHENMYFPLFIPESYLMKEAEHVEGFAPEVAWVTQGGSKQLEERLAIRPTSETIICSLYADWIHSWRDLPVLINQWANVVRWEKRTRLFLRTSEFLWQEGHTFHETDEEAAHEVRTMLGCYRELAEEWLALPVISGRKTESEKFAGARYTLSIEAMMSDGWALQSGTSHHLGQNFTEAYDISYSDRDNRLQHPFQTSWGVSTRIVGGIIMGHGDDNGLILPPRVAPVQVVVVPIMRSNDPEGSALVEEACARLERESSENAMQVDGNLRSSAVRLRVDRREGIRPGEKYAHWELRGVPLRVVCGPKDLAEGRVTVVRRVDGEQRVLPVEGLAGELPGLVDDAHRATWERARRLLEERSVDVTTVEELREAFQDAPVFANAPFCESAQCETTVKESVHAGTVRVLRDDREPEGATCLACDRPATAVALIARAY